MNKIETLYENTARLEELKNSLPNPSIFRMMGSIMFTESGAYWIPEDRRDMSVEDQIEYNKKHLEGFAGVISV